MLHISRETWGLMVIAGFVGAALSVPFQLATGLMFPSVQRWFDARLKARAFAKSKRTRKEYDEARYFVMYPDKMTHYFLNRGLEVLRLSVFLLIVFIGMAYLPANTLWNMIGFGVPIIFLILTISQAVNQLHDIYLRVEFWDEYKKEVALELPDVGTGA